MVATIINTISTVNNTNPGISCEGRFTPSIAIIGIALMANVVPSIAIREFQSIFFILPPFLILVFHFLKARIFMPSRMWPRWKDFQIGRVIFSILQWSFELNENHDLFLGEMPLAQNEEEIHHFQLLQSLNRLLGLGTACSCNGHRICPILRMGRVF